MTNMSEVVKFLVGRVEYIVGKEENACCKHFLLFQQSIHSVVLTHSHTITPFYAPGKQTF